jgi:formylglycine-generating enzyme required for sulfatase activity
MRSRGNGFYSLVLIVVLLCGFSLARAQGGTGKLPPRPIPRPIPRPPGPRVPVTLLPPPCSARSPSRATGRTHSASLPNGVRLELVELPAGSFCMGSENGAPDEKPPHKVTVKPFYIGKYEVTQQQWQALMGNNPSNFKNCGGTCPVEQVSWDDAQRFITRLNSLNDGFVYRLPSEAEWEYAVRAATTGDYAGNPGLMAWFADNAGNQTHPVGQKQPNSFGLHDMHGNVNEWCEDWYHLNLGYRGAPADGNVWESRGEQTMRVVRGGSARNNPTNLRSASRGKSEPGSRSAIIIGFRVVAVSRSR